LAFIFKKNAFYVIEITFTIRDPPLCDPAQEYLKVCSTQSVQFFIELGDGSLCGARLEGKNGVTTAAVVIELAQR
jgi:hypothetical protein